MSTVKEDGEAVKPVGVEWGRINVELKRGN